MNTDVPSHVTIKGRQWAVKTVPNDVVPTTIAVSRFWNCPYCGAQDNEEFYSDDPEHGTCPSCSMVSRIERHETCIGKISLFVHGIVGDAPNPNEVSLSLHCEQFDMDERDGPIFDLLEEICDGIDQSCQGDNIFSEEFNSFRRLYEGIRNHLESKVVISRQDASRTSPPSA